jgi:hypothetical protein
MSYYSLIKAIGFLMHAITWKSLENIRQGEIFQTQKDKYFMIPFI